MRSKETHAARGSVNGDVGVSTEVEGTTKHDTVRKLWSREDGNLCLEIPVDNIESAFTAISDIAVVVRSVLVEPYEDVTATFSRIAGEPGEVGVQYEMTFLLPLDFDVVPFTVHLTLDEITEQRVSYLYESKAELKVSFSGNANHIGFEKKVSGRAEVERIQLPEANGLREERIKFTLPDPIAQVRDAVGELCCWYSLFFCGVPLIFLPCYLGYVVTNGHLAVDRAVQYLTAYCRQANITLATAVEDAPGTRKGLPEDRIEALHELYTKGALTQEEFEACKAKVMKEF